MGTLADQVAELEDCCDVLETRLLLIEENTVVVDEDRRARRIKEQQQRIGELEERCGDMEKQLEVVINHEYALIQTLAQIRTLVKDWQVEGSDADALSHAIINALGKHIGIE